MEAINQIILLGSFLLLLSIFLGQVSARFGAPILLVFLILGMLAGEDGPGGILFNDHKLTYLVGNIALAIILFEGGLSIPKASFKAALAPALSLATFGVFITCCIVSFFVVTLFRFTWLQGFLLGSIISSTDAAAVFLILHTRGIALRKQVSATLEVESGINDPMAVFLTITCINLMLSQQVDSIAVLVLHFIREMGGGIIIGLTGGYGLLFLVNRLKIAAGLYPVLAAAAALFIFAGAQALGSSGYLAAYLAGLVLGQNQHSAIKSIRSFHNGLAWLSQIVMFLLLGLLVTPSKLVPILTPSLIVAAILTFFARPIAVHLCLLPFAFSKREKIFISWVGLRGAIPIFLATLPILYGIADANIYFGIVFVTVLVSLLVQGWSVAGTARWLKLPAVNDVK